MWTSTPTTSMPGSRRGLGVEGAGAGDGDAELVLGLAGGDLGVAAGVDVGVDAERDRRGAAELGRDLGERDELGLGFDVELADAVPERERHLGAGLADAGEDDALAGTPAARARRYSPSETTSMPAPSEAIRRRTARLAFAFIA